MSGSKLTWFLCRGIKIYFNSGVGRNYLDFSGESKLAQFLCRESNFIRFLCGWSKKTCFRVGIGLDLISVSAPELTWF